MIEITRALARQLRAVFRKAIPIGTGRSPRLPLAFHASKDGLRVRAHHLEVMTEFHLPGARPADVVALPAEVLNEIEGRKEDAVALEATEAGTVQARWHDGGVPQVRDYTAPDLEKLPHFPEECRKLLPIDPGILKSLDDASQTAARESVRFAAQRIQLGGTGDIIATDGRQLLVQGNFALPWKDDLLVPATSVFACRELPQDGPVAIGKADQHVCVRVGPWTFFLAIDVEGRFPDAKAVIPVTTGATVCRLSAEDAAFLAQALPRLPGKSDDHAPLTVDLNGHVAVRARGEGESRPTEVVLSRSEVVGPPVRIATDRQYLARAVALGFTELRLTKPDASVVCADNYRTYVWVSLGADGALPPGDDVLRINSAGAELATHTPKKERSKDFMAKQSPASVQAKRHAASRRTNDNGHTANPIGLGALIEEAHALKVALHDAYGRTARLVSALKRHKRQSRLMATTLASLRQLQQLEPMER